MLWNCMRPDNGHVKTLVCFNPVSNLIFHRFHQACDVARVRASQSGHEGEALVGFGEHKAERLQDLYDAKDKERVGFVKWLRRKTPQPGSQMNAALKYIRMRDHEVAAAAASGGPTSTPAAPAPVPIQPPPSPRPASQAQKGRLGAVVSQCLGQQRPLTPQALQAKVMKVIKPSLKPAAPAVSTPHQSAQDTFTDAELVGVVDKYEN
ncbi:uncharacterized protein LOC124474763 [Hypomesus transpacificus]|uniref:uncharacterized protein LOC124474763 n=1 Tax=Hypomesus transpacificus TaxID=137520 RepID=UPI001F0845E5|nr:uncharacterized protein LOC124474763 [Hypomesus transpacificus]XP_046887138.1 uncharacterized protein LOC124474763 [Hypomesus transpacificus]XP_046887139.1 uncharacterized protein LOC124474763 [Hypomesus transpacificus]